VPVGAGRGGELQRDVALVIAELRRMLPQALESEEAVARRTEVVESAERAARELSESFRVELERDEYVILRENETDYALLPAHAGEPLTHEAYGALPEELRGTIDVHVKDARNRLLGVHRRMHELQREARAGVVRVNQETTRAAVAQHLELLRPRWAGEPAALAHFAGLAEDIVRHQDSFASPEPEKPGLQALMPQDDFFKRYDVNVVVRNEPGAGAPVVEERHPTYAALVGHVARQLHFGVIVTDFTGITAGALHRANGGYLVLDAEELLSRPLAWSALKRVLRTRELKPVEPSGEMGLVVTDMLDPEPIPAALKVILVGEPDTFYLLRAADDEFRELFKVKADFRPDVERTPETERAYAAFVASAAPREGAPPFDVAAVA
jgi:predicted ATP-dependent protease